MRRCFAWLLLIALLPWWLATPPSAAIGQDQPEESASTEHAPPALRVRAGAEIPIAIDPHGETPWVDLRLDLPQGTWSACVHVSHGTVRLLHLYGRRGEAPATPGDADCTTTVHMGKGFLYWDGYSDPPLPTAGPLALRLRFRPRDVDAFEPDPAVVTARIVVRLDEYHPDVAAVLAPGQPQPVRIEESAPRFVGYVAEIPPGTARLGIALAQASATTAVHVVRGTPMADWVAHAAWSAETEDGVAALSIPDPNPGRYYVDVVLADLDARAGEAILTLSLEPSPE